MDADYRNPTPQPFDLGQVRITAQASETLHPDDVHAAVLRHSVCDWGDCCLHDCRQNNFAVRNECRILSVYHDRNDVTFWIITEADRTRTTVLLPEEY